MDDVTREVVELTREMVTFESTKSRPEELRRCLDYVKQYFAGTGLVLLEMERHHKPSLLVSFAKTKTPQVLFLGHVDVIEGEREQFTAVERDGKLFGRGTDDMKLQDAVMMVLLKRLAQRGERRDVMLALTTDEEISGEDGAKYLVEQCIRPEIVFAPDAGNDMGVVVKEKGILHLGLTFTGKAAHGSRPWMGDNAIDKAIRAYARIRRLFPKTTAKDRWKATCSMGVLRGGEAANKVPDRAEMELDIRYTAPTTEKEILDKIRNITDAKLEFLSRGAPLDTPEENPWVQRFLACSAEVLGKPAEIQGGHGASDVRHFADAGIPGFLCAVPGSGAHGPEEYADITRIVPFYSILERFVSHVRKI